MDGGNWGRLILPAALLVGGWIALRMLFAPAAAPQLREIAVGSLIEEMTDLLAVAKTPDPLYTAHMASSYDRRSISPSDPETWFANEDWASVERPNYVAVDRIGARSEYVLLDVQGPGAVVRIWSATPTGTLRVYLDGATEPALEAKLDALLSGRDVIPAPFAYVAARGYNAYFPIPFAKGCKITVDDIVATDPWNGTPLEKFYYQINYRSYSVGVAPRVRTFSQSELARARPAIERAAEVLAHPWAAYQPSPQRERLALTRAGDDLTVTIEKPGGGVVRELVVRAADAAGANLQSAELTLTFDGEATVRAPLTDFLGSGPGRSPYESLSFSVGADRLAVRWPMPFRERAQIAIHGAPDALAEVSVEPLGWTQESFYFHAARRGPTTVRTRPPSDLSLLSVAGRGVYVGNVFNLSNPREAQWWGEGDEKVYVDGEAFPSLFGTGTEDYYGYAWSTTERFSTPFHAQTRAGDGGFGGYFSMNRMQLLDAVPFSSGLRFDLEIWHWDDTSVRYDSVAYYYAGPGARERAGATR